MTGHNRLQLDFSLTTNEQRAEFLNTYLQSPQFIKRPPTDEELETMGNYLLWGKDPTTGLNAKQQGLVDLESKHGTWDKSNEVESLDGLLETPTFNEASIAPDNYVPTKKPREVFSRSEALANCPDYLVEPFHHLFRQIDELDLAITYYELDHNKRTKEPRAALVAKFTEEEQTALHARAASWNQYTYLKQRHQLVELRREQYTLRDAYRNPLMVELTPSLNINRVAQIDADIEVLPLGTSNNSPLAHLLFRPWQQMNPAEYSDEEMRDMLEVYWRKQSYKPGTMQQYLDFRDWNHVYQIFQLFFELKDEEENADLESNLPALMRTLRFYIDGADLSEMHQEILDMKLKKVKNADIAAHINKKWKKTYTSNYISTIFC